VPHSLYSAADVQRYLDAGAQLVEVLPAEEFEEAHLPGAVSIPLRHIEREARERLDVAKAVVVYCWDTT
jgi:rhodanese-related sulfurtransferase